MFAESWLRVGVLLCLSSAGTGAAEKTVRIVEHGEARSVVVVGNEADAQTRDAAELLVEYVQRASGAKLRVLSAEDATSGITARPGPLEPNGAKKRADAARDSGRVPVTIHVGRDPYVEGLGLKRDSLDDDGFLIKVSDSSNVVIVGPTPWGTEFGVCEFLERFVGVRWLMPGPDGEDVPKRRAIEVPVGTDIRSEPAFFSRQFSGLVGAVQTNWARRNRMHGRVSFHHNLLNLFPPSKYAKTHPEFFPIRSGKRYIPPNDHTHGWQPCFSAPGIVEEAARTICRYFDQHPEATSYSLGVTDSSGHCQCERCRAQDPPEPNFLGRRNVSDRYYAWCNRVVERVLEKHPDKWFGCLAYSEVAQPPSRIKVHPRIIPYMTYDRMKWADPDLRAEGERLTRWWHRTSPVVGWYDYIYGTPYCVPRVWFHLMADYLRFAQANGVRAFYAEAYPNWGEGPKLYATLKLLWDPHQDVDVLLRDWYVRAVGPDAADALAEYYTLWEDFWTRRVLNSAWFTQGGQYLRFNNPSYLAEVTKPDIRRSRELLERAVKLARTEKQKARAKLLLRAFEYYEASALAYAGAGSKVLAVPRTETEALASINQALEKLEMARKRLRLAEEFVRHPVLVHPLPPSRYSLLSGAGWGGSSIWGLLDWIGRSQRVKIRVEQLAETATGEARRQARAVLTVADATSQPISSNPSFESPDGRWPKPWSPWVKWGIGRMTVANAAARTGQRGILCRGVKRGGPHQALKVSPGYYAAVGYFRVPKQPESNATVTINMTPLDEQGHNLPSIAHSVPATATDWTAIAVSGLIPAEIQGQPVSRVRLIVIVDGFQPGEEVYLDDVAMYRVE
ncbi:MAG: DUF4838 domain-containing protein [Planctomycetes bacterium]|nr:DUF4838 domain-containing protein [Planctomycetota bacterium]